MTHRMRYKIMLLIVWGAIMATIQILCVLDLLGVESVLFQQHPVDCFLWLYSLICLIGISMVRKDSLTTPPDVIKEKDYGVYKHNLIIRVGLPISTYTLQRVVRVLSAVLLGIYTAVTLRLIYFLFR